MVRVFPVQRRSRARQTIESESRDSPEQCCVDISQFLLISNANPLPEEKKSEILGEIVRVGHESLSTQNGGVSCPNRNAQHPCLSTHTRGLFNDFPWFAMEGGMSGVFSAVYHPHQPTAHAVWRDATILMKYYPCVRVVIFCLTHCSEHYVVQGAQTTPGVIEFKTVPYDGVDWYGWVMSTQVPHDDANEPQGALQTRQGKKGLPVEPSAKGVNITGHTRKKKSYITTLVEESEGETVAHVLDKSVDLAWLEDSVRETLMNMKIDDLRAFIRNRRIDVKTNVGGQRLEVEEKPGRTKQDIVDDVLAQDGDWRSSERRSRQRK